MPPFENLPPLHTTNCALQSLPLIQKKKNRTHVGTCDKDLGRCGKHMGRCDKQASRLLCTKSFAGIHLLSD